MRSGKKVDTRQGWIVKFCEIEQTYGGGIFSYQNSYVKYTQLGNNLCQPKPKKNLGRLKIVEVVREWWWPK